MELVGVIITGIGALFLFLGNFWNIEIAGCL